MNNKTLIHVRTTMGITKAGTIETLLYVGIEEGLRYIEPFIAQKIFISFYSVRQSVIHDTNLKELLDNSEHELILIVLDKKKTEEERKKHDLISACRIHQVVNTDSDLNTALSRMSNRESKRRTKSLKMGFKYSISTADYDFFDFYRNMHTPTMTSRYGNLARSVEESDAYTDLFQQGHLFKIFLDQIWLAGSVCQIDPNLRKINARLLGVLEGKDVYRNNGAQNFVYHAIIDWACNSPNIDLIDFQGCEPFLTKGTFQYKKRFGARAVIPDNLFGELRLIMRVNKLTRSIRRFLIDNPSIVITETGHLSARYFQDNTTQFRADIPFECDGIETKILLDVDDWYE